MNGRRHGTTLAACLAGVANQAVITNVTALLFVPFSRLYGFSLAQLGVLTAVNFAAQMCADIFLLFFIDRLSYKGMALFAAALSAGGLLFYGAVPVLFSGGAVYGGIAAATAVFAFSGGMLEIVLSGAAERLPRGSPVSICLLHTAYAWAQAALALLLFGFVFICGAEHWNISVMALAAVPVLAFILLLRADLGPPAHGKARRKRGANRLPSAFFLLAVAAIFFGHGSEVTMNQWISTLFSETAGETGYAGEFIGAALFAAFLGAGGIFYVRISAKGDFPLPVLVFSGLLTFLCYLAVSAGGGRLAFAAAAACGLFVGVLSPGIMTASGENLPRTGGRMLASLAVAADMGAAALPAAAGALSEITGFGGAFRILSAAPLCCALAAAAMVRLGRPPRRCLRKMKM